MSPDNIQQYLPSSHICSLPYFINHYNLYLITILFAEITSGEVT